jgi:formate dehydrogenase subunit delta
VDEENMLHKANGIADFFAAYPHEEAVAGIAAHLRMYWVPRMRAQIIEYVRVHGGKGLHELVPEAVGRLEAPVIRT